MTNNSFDLKQVYKTKKTDRDIFQELMPMKVREILIISSLYDAFNIQREGQFSDEIVGEYLQLRLFSAPRFTSASNEDEAIEILQNKHFDLIIVMCGFDKEFSINACKRIKKEKIHTPILLLLNNKNLLWKYDKIIEDNKGSRNKIFDRAFIWNGNSTIFFAMIKYIEDKKNAKNDTEKGDVRVILLVEDSIRYYSSYLPVLYNVVLKQTQKVIEDHSIYEETSTIFKMRVRPKIILATNYERAVREIKKYKNNLLCVISDIRYPYKGEQCDTAGLKLVKYLHKNAPTIKTLLQSSDKENEINATKLGVEFIDKNSSVLHNRLENFMYQHLGFGSFNFKREDGRLIKATETFQDFEKTIQKIPLDSIIHHSQRHSFSTWLMARGEINLAKKLRLKNLDDFNHEEEVREFILNSFKKAKIEKIKGKIIPFDKSISEYKNHIVQISSGSMGGKGRGLAFISHILENINLGEIEEQINIMLPQSAIIGVNNFIDFVAKNKIYERVLYKKKKMSDEKITQLFLKGKFSAKIKNRLIQFLEIQKNPIAIRSSGLFEDAMANPFAGLYKTYFLANNQTDIKIRYKELEDAIKSIYASIFVEKARNYFDATGFKQEEEKMAIVIQEMVGTAYENRFYPHISGVAQSYNYYPFSYIKPTDGLVVMAVGLGVYTVNGEKTYRFCPEYPKLEIKELQDVVKDSQTHFVALDLNKENIDFTLEDESDSLLRCRLKTAEEDGSLKHCASVYNADNDILEVNFEKRGKRVVNFANILQYEYTPLAKAIRQVLSLFEQALSYPVEIEFAVNLNPDKKQRPTLYILQVKPFIKPDSQMDIDMDEYENETPIIQSDKVVGNGLIDNIKKILYVKPESFDKMQTLKIKDEISTLNKKLEGENYILVGPGRWGTRDRFIGIPVEWTDISNAKLMVEYGLDNLPLDGSLGSHFFHNIVTMSIGYFSIEHTHNNIDFEVLNNQRVIEETEFVKLIEFEEGITAIMDAHKSEGKIFINKA